MLLDFHGEEEFHLVEFYRGYGLVIKRKKKKQVAEHPSVRLAWCRSSVRKTQRAVLTGNVKNGCPSVLPFFHLQSPLWICMRTADAGQLRGHLAALLAVGAQLMLNKMYLFELAHFRGGAESVCGIQGALEGVAPPPPINRFTP